MAKFWRSHPLSGNGSMFWISPWVELVYGRITIADHRTDTVPHLLNYAAAFANGEEAQFSLRFAPDNDKKKLEAIEQEVRPDRLAARRAELKQLLRVAVRGPSEPDDPDFENQSVEFLESVNQRADKRIEWILSLERNVGWQMIGTVNECDGFVALVTSLLLAKTNRQYLGQCGHCERFFIVESTEGKPRKRYCSDNCMLATNAKGSADRQRQRYKRNCAGAILLDKWAGRAPSDEVITQAVRRVSKEYPDATAEHLAERAQALISSDRKRK